MLHDEAQAFANAFTVVGGLAVGLGLATWMIDTFVSARRARRR